MHQPRPDIFFTPTHYAPRFSPVPTVITILDLAYLYFPEMFKKTDLFKLKNWTSRSVRNAKSIITISLSTKNDIIKEYHVPEEKVVVVYPGIKPTSYHHPQSCTMDTLQSKYQISKNFILFVGTIQPRKNIARLIEAFAKTLTQEKMPPDLQLVIVGKKGWLYEDIIKKPKELGIEEKVKFLDFVTDDELTVFYKNAICYVLPSLYEGFGLPVLEAMQHNCPVITSNVSSLPEAGGDAALYVNPEDVSDIADKMNMLIINKQLRQELIEKGKKQITKFSWEKTAKETLKILEAV
jgi:glycosyltransferase involved in cell wall biosynthesis